MIADDSRFVLATAGLVLCLLPRLAQAADGQASSTVTVEATNARTVAVVIRQSPVETFRRLLAMGSEERSQSLAMYPPPHQERIIAKLQEYQMLPEPLRELRLQATELRWYLLPLLSSTVTNRTEELKRVPEPYQRLIAARLAEWDLWPPTLKEEVLEYESTMQYFVGRNAEPQPQMGVPSLPESERSELERKLERWKALPEGQRQQMYGAFRHYFELSDEERQRTLDALSETERHETEKALDPIEKWPKPQQDKYMAAFQQFANMSARERQQFAKNAERWQKMSETERQAWRDLVKQLADAPPLPPGFVPPNKQPAGAGASSMQTNPTSARSN
jgi:hypothetical protein